MLLNTFVIFSQKVKDRETFLRRAGGQNDMVIVSRFGLEEFDADMLLSKTRPGANGRLNCVLLAHTVQYHLKYKRSSLEALCLSGLSPTSISDIISLSSSSPQTPSATSNVRCRFVSTVATARPKASIFTCVRLHEKIVLMRAGPTVPDRAEK